jgi:16S rRNA (guanine966-N2)-methyltransferase
MLTPYGKIYLETERQLKLQSLPDNWLQLKDKVAGEVRYSLYQNQN